MRCFEDNKLLKEKLTDINVILKKSNKLNTRYKFIICNNPEYLQYIVEDTCFLRYDAPIKVRLQCIIQGIDTQPMCTLCGEPCKMITNGSKNNNKFSTYCSRICSGIASVQN